MLMKIARRQMSQIVKQEGLQRPVATQATALYELQGYQTDALRSYFEQDALLFPAETIVEKVETKDYEFFLS